MTSKSKKNFGKKITRTFFIRFLVTVTLFLALILITYLLCDFVLGKFLWYPEDLLYRLLKLIKFNAFWLILLCGFAGFIGIFYFYWRKTLSLIDTVVEASATLIEQGDTQIELPHELNQVEARLNQAKQEMQRSARLAKEAEQRKNEMVMYLAHDIKTPLTSVIGYLSLLEEAPDMPAEQKARYVNITLEKAFKLERLVDEFFEITRLSFQAGLLFKEQIDLYYMLVQMVDEFYPLLNAKENQTLLSIPEQLTVYGDPNQLARVFNNVLKNAVVYSPAGTTIEITASATDNMTSIVFANEGSVPQDKLSLIFDKFYRLDSARSSDTGGAGLGLAIAREIVVSHRGQIYAESSNNHTFFTVKIPVAPRQL